AGRRARDAPAASSASGPDTAGPTARSGCRGAGRAWGGLCRVRSIAPRVPNLTFGQDPRGGVMSERTIAAGLTALSFTFAPAVQAQATAPAAEGAALSGHAKGRVD